MNKGAPLDKTSWTIRF